MPLIWVLGTAAAVLIGVTCRLYWDCGWDVMVPVRIDEGRICSNPCWLATSSMLLKYYLVRNISVAELKVRRAAGMPQPLRFGVSWLTLTVLTCSSKVASSSHTIMG